jgi:hypothetical protein
MVPRVEREEFINVGMVLFCKEKDFLQCRTFLNTDKLRCLDLEIDLLQITENLGAFEQIAAGTDQNSKIAKLDVPSRFRWLTATRSTIIQCSRVHPGFSFCLEDDFERLFQKLVL